VGPLQASAVGPGQAAAPNRDIKPGNVLLWNAAEEDEHAMLTDFGIAKGLDDPRSITGVAPVGTPAYMAPEVFLARPVTAASDQYSLACMAFEMLSGRLPLEADDAGYPDAHLEQPAPRSRAAHLGFDCPCCRSGAREGPERPPRQRQGTRPRSEDRRRRVSHFTAGEACLGRQPEGRGSCSPA